MALQELLNRTALETQKLELMTEVSSLKLKLTAVERDHRDNEVHPRPDVCEEERELMALIAPVPCFLHCDFKSWQLHSHCFKVTKVSLT